MIRFALVFLLGLLVHKVPAQRTVDTTFYRIQLNTIKKTEASSPEEAIKAYKKLRESARSDHYLEAQLTASLGISNVYHYSGDAEASKKIADSVAKVANLFSLKKIEAKALYNVAQSSHRLNKWYAAAEASVSALKIGEEISDAEIQKEIYRVLGNVYNSMGDNVEARKYYSLGMNLAKKLGDRWKYVVNYYNFANSLMEEGAFDEALTILNEISQELWTMDTDNALSLRCYLEQVRLACRPKDKALLEEIHTNLKYLQRNTKRFTRGVLDKIPLFMALLDYALLSKDAQMAKKYMLRTEPLVKVFGQYMELTFLNQKSKYYEMIGNNKKALELFKEYDKRTIEATKTRERDRIHELNLRFDTERKDIQIAAKDLELQLLAESAEKQKLYLVFIFAAIFSLGLSILVLYLKNKNQLLDKAKRAALEAAKTKSLFLDVMTHELRTPLSTIAGSLFLLKEERDPANRESLLKGIQFSSEYLNKLVENTILLKTLGDSNSVVEDTSQKPIGQEFNCKELVEGVCKSMAHSQNQNQIEIDLEDNLPKVLIGPELDLSRVLINLVSNSDKFTHNGLIKISVRQTASEREHTTRLTFSVSDNGDGIKEEEKERIFDAFYSGNDYKDKEYPGMGLGLNLVKGLLQRHGALPKLQSVYGLGTTISFTMDFDVPEGLQNHDHERVVKERPKDCILLVEDNKANQDMTKKIIERLGYQCDVADNGKMAVEKYRLLPYSLVLMDIMMPVMNGFEATASINKIDPKAKVVALTAISKEKHKEAFKEVNINTVISKPVNIRLIKETIEQHLNHGPQAA